MSSIFQCWSTLYVILSHLSVIDAVLFGHKHTPYIHFYKMLFLPVNCLHQICYFTPGALLLIHVTLTLYIDRWKKYEGVRVLGWLTLELSLLLQQAGLMLINCFVVLILLWHNSLVLQMLAFFLKLKKWFRDGIEYVKIVKIWIVWKNYNTCTHLIQKSEILNNNLIRQSISKSTDRNTVLIWNNGK